MRSLSMNCSLPSGQHMAGNHHASSSRSVEPPTFSPARMPSPMDAGLPKLQSFSRTGRCCLRHWMSWSNPPAARMTPCRAPMRCWRPFAFDDRAGHLPVDVGDQLGHRRAQPQRDAVLLQSQPHPRRQRLADRGHPVAEYPRPEHPPDQLHQHGLAPPVLAHLVEEPKILGGEPDSLGRQRQRLQQVLFLVAELAQIDRGHVDRAAQLGAAGQFRVVVGIAGLPDEFEPRAALLEELHHLGCGVDVLAQSRVADKASGDPLQVIEHAIGIRNVALFALRRCARHPDAATRQRGGTAELR